MDPAMFGQGGTPGAKTESTSPKVESGSSKTDDGLMSWLTWIPSSIVNMTQGIIDPGKILDNVIEGVAEMGKSTILTMWNSILPNFSKGSDASSGGAAVPSGA